MSVIRYEDRVYYHLKHPAKKRSDNKRIRAAITAAGCHVYDIAGRLGIGEATLYRWLRWELPEQKYLLIMEAIEYEAALRGKTFPGLMADLSGLPWDNITPKSCQECEGCNDLCPKYESCTRNCPASRGTAAEVGVQPDEAAGPGE